MTESPKKPTVLRRLAHKLHLCLGVTVGFYILVMSLSGTSLVFADEILGFLEPSVPKSSELERCSYDEAFQNVKKKFNGYEIKHLHVPVSQSSPLELYLYRGNERLVELVNPYTATPMGQRNPIVQFVMNLHFDLLNGEFGRTMNGFGASCLFTILISGIVIWWQGLSRVGQRLSIDFKTNWRRINWDIHTALSIWAVPFVLIWATSGFYFGFPDIFKQGLSFLLPNRKIEATHSIPLSTNFRRELDLDKLATTLEAQLPGFQVRWVKLSSGGTKVARVRLGAPGVSSKDKLITVNFLPETGKVKNVVSPVDKQNSQLFIDFLKKLHFGSIFGVYSKILWLVIGLVPATLFTTGFLIWFNKYRARKINESKKL